MHRAKDLSEAVEGLTFAAALEKLSASSFCLLNFLRRALPGVEIKGVVGWHEDVV